MNDRQFYLRESAIELGIDPSAPDLEQQVEDERKRREPCFRCKGHGPRTLALAYCDACVALNHAEEAARMEKGLRNARLCRERREKARLSGGRRELDYEAERIRETEEARLAGWDV